MKNFNIKNKDNKISQGRDKCIESLTNALAKVMNLIKDY